MATFSKTVYATSGALFAKEGGEPPQVSGKDQHIALYSAKSDGVTFHYSGVTRFSLSSSDPIWSGVINVKKVVLRFINVEHGPHPAARVKSGYQIREIGKPFDDNGEEEGYWEIDSALRMPSATGRVRNGAVALTTVGVPEDIDITDWFRSWAPKRVKVAGRAGLGHTHFGIWVARRESTAQSNPRIVWGSADAPNESDRPQLIMTFEGGDPIGSMVVTGPESPIPGVAGVNFEGSYIPGVEGARLARLHIRLHKRNPTDTNWVEEPVWQNGGTDGQGEAVSASETETGDWLYPVSSVRIGTGSLVSGTRYGWSARGKSNKGIWTAASALTEIKVEADAPVFEARDLMPNADGTAATFAEPEMPTLENVQFGGRFPAYGANLIHGLLSYRVQVLEETVETDPAWDDGEMLWDSGEVTVGADQTIPPSPTRPLIFGSSYRGSSLGAGMFSFRVRVTNTAGKQGLWAYGTFSLTVGQELDPGDNPGNLIGYARQHPKFRIRIRHIDASLQRLVVKTTGGSYKLSYDGDGVARTTDWIAYNASAATIQTTLLALPGIADAVVTGPAVTGNSRKYYITITQTGSLDVLPLKIAQTNSVFKDAHGKINVSVASNRRPGRTIALIDDAANIGASEYYNSPGEFYFTLPATHPQISVIEPWQVHYTLELHRGNGWEEATAGIIYDFDASPDDVIFYGADYLGVLGMMIDERFNPEGSSKRPAQLYPPSDPATDGSYYFNKTIKQIVTDQIDRAIHDTDSPLAFFSRGAIADMSETIIIYCTFKPRLEFIAGLLESWKGKGITSKRTRIRSRHNGSTWEFRVDDNPGYSRDNIRFEYGGLVNDFRVVPFGSFGTRVNAIGREIGGSKVQYVIAKTPVPEGEDEDYNENRYGRWPTTNLWQDVTDQADLSRRARQFARSLGKVGKQVALAIRVDAMALKSGWDITDSVKVDIRRGIVDTTLYGSGYWTIWGWVLKISPDGHTDLQLSILPREDTEAAAEDITPSAPILSALSEWQIAPADPTPEDALNGARRWTNSVTGEMFEVDDETGLWVSTTITMTGSPRMVATGAVGADDFAGNVKAVYRVTDLPLLPDLFYPEDAVVYSSTLHGLYKNVADVWVTVEGPAAADHIADTSDAHDASAISLADAGGLYTATDVEAALAEVATAVAGSGVSFDTPSIALGSSAGAGAASTVIRSDATIAAFDTTDPSTQAFGDAAVVGTAAYAARRDHKHGMPAAGGGISAANFVFGEVPSGAINGSNDTFVCANTPTAGTQRVYKNGLRQNVGAGLDYTFATATITFLAGNIPQTGDIILVDYMK